ncbi:hypothetical protein FRC03_010064 [Tulasnella sp. 419]|nr:hypothetical protein FRC03_010064 [Tulasnella sp. 419]
MSLQFPHCEVIGLDLVPPKIRDAVFPENCRFEIDDGNLSFTHWTNKFDVVHARCINEGIQDFPLFLNHLAQTMKPGAILILGNGTPQFYDEDEQPYQDVNEGEEGKIHSTSLGIDPDDSLYAPLLWDKWARNNPNFVNVNTLDMKLKVGNWSSESSEEIANANELCKLDVLMLIKSYIPLMGSSGYSPEVIEHWSKVKYDSKVAAWNKV